MVTNNRDPDRTSASTDEHRPTLPAKRLTVEERAIWATEFVRVRASGCGVWHAADTATRTVESYREDFLQLVELPRTVEVSGSVRETVFDMECAPFLGTHVRPLTNPREIGGMGHEPAKKPSFKTPVVAPNYSELAEMVRTAIGFDLHTAGCRLAVALGTGCEWPELVDRVVAHIKGLEMQRDKLQAKIDDALDTLTLVR